MPPRATCSASLGPTRLGFVRVNGQYSGPRAKCSGDRQQRLAVPSKPTKSVGGSSPGWHTKWRQSRIHFEWVSRIVVVSYRSGVFAAAPVGPNLLPGAPLAGGFLIFRLGVAS